MRASRGEGRDPAWCHQVLPAPPGDVPKSGTPAGDVAVGRSQQQLLGGKRVSDRHWSSAPARGQLGRGQLRGAAARGAGSGVSRARSGTRQVRAARPQRPGGPCTWVWSQGETGAERGPEGAEAPAGGRDLPPLLRSTPTRAPRTAVDSVSSPVVGPTCRLLTGILFRNRVRCCSPSSPRPRSDSRVPRTVPVPHAAPSPRCGRRSLSCRWHRACLMYNHITEEKKNTKDIFFFSFSIL